jgi:pilus assembly protein CpaC
MFQWGLVKMNAKMTRSQLRLGLALAALSIGLNTVAVSPAVANQASSYRPSSQVQLSIGEGQVIRLDRPIADIWVSNEKVADVHVTNSRQLNIFGKERGEATIIATAANGTVVYATNVRVSQNLSSVNEVLRTAMPGSDITVTTVGQVAVINGTVASPEEAAQAETIVTSILNPGKKSGDMLDIVPVNRLRSAVPLQVNLRVRIAEVNRSALKQIGVNLLSLDPTSGFQFGISQGSPAATSGAGGVFRTVGTGAGLSIGGAGRLFGLDLRGALDLLATDGLVTTLAEPNLTALSGETASFLAGGEFPIPVSQGVGGAITVEYKQYGVGLAFTPVVLADGRISMRVRPEVSELSNEGSLRLNGFEVPALTTRRAETTVELGSGQSFMLAGLLRTSNQNSIERAPFLGDLPVLGTLFRSTRFRKAETELVIIVTPYLVRPVNGRLATPVDGYRTPRDGTVLLEGQTFNGVSGRGAATSQARPVAVGAGGTVAASAAPAPSAPVPAPGFKL